MILTFFSCLCFINQYFQKTHNFNLRIALLKMMYYITTNKHYRNCSIEYGQIVKGYDKSSGNIENVWKGNGEDYLLLIHCIGISIAINPFKHTDG